jgi:hypothetical protein
VKYTKQVEEARALLEGAIRDLDEQDVKIQALPDDAPQETGWSPSRRRGSSSRPSFPRTTRRSRAARTGGPTALASRSRRP